jgi:hypothetical protein
MLFAATGAGVVVGVGVGEGVEETYSLLLEFCKAGAGANNIYSAGISKKGRTLLGLLKKDN